MSPLPRDQSDLTRARPGANQKITPPAPAAFALSRVGHEPERLRCICHAVIALEALHSLDLTQQLDNGGVITLLRTVQSSWWAPNGDAESL